LHPVHDLHTFQRKKLAFRRVSRNRKPAEKPHVKSCVQVVSRIDLFFRVSVYDKTSTLSSIELFHTLALPYNRWARRDFDGIDSITQAASRKFGSQATGSNT
jgi:hypothetical protein